jgi:hypothetical protein
MRSLKSIGYQGDLTFECDGFFAKLPPKVYPQASALLAATGRNLIGIMESNLENSD